MLESVVFCRRNVRFNTGTNHCDSLNAKLLNRVWEDVAEWMHTQSECLKAAFAQ